jgi:hypothetical protein
MPVCGAFSEFDALRNALDICTSKLEWGMVRHNALMDRHASANDGMECRVFEVLCTAVRIDLAALVVNDD